MSEIMEKWESIKEKVREEFEISDVSFRTWITPLKISLPWASGTPCLAGFSPTSWLFLPSF